MRKNINLIAVILSVVLLLSLCAGCAKEEQPLAQVSEQMTVEEPVAVEATENAKTEPSELQLSQEDKDLLAAMEPDIIVIDDASFPETVTELMYHVGSYTGKVYQLEGAYSTQLDGIGTPYLYRVLVNGEESTIAALPVVYFADEIAENSWIRVTAIVGVGEVNGVESTVLEVVAVENTEPGNAELEWSGSAHSHSH